MVLKVTVGNKVTVVAVIHKPSWNNSGTGDDYDRQNRGRTEIVKGVCDYKKKNKGTDMTILGYFDFKN